MIYLYKTEAWNLNSCIALNLSGVFRSLDWKVSTMKSKRLAPFLSNEFHLYYFQFYMLWPELQFQNEKIHIFFDRDIFIC